MRPFYRDLHQLTNAEGAMGSRPTSNVFKGGLVLMPILTSSKAILLEITRLVGGRGSAECCRNASSRTSGGNKSPNERRKRRLNTMGVEIQKPKLEISTRKKQDRDTAATRRWSRPITGEQRKGNALDSTWYSRGSDTEGGCGEGPRPSYIGTPFCTGIRGYPTILSRSSP